MCGKSMHWLSLMPANFESKMMARCRESRVIGPSFMSVTYAECPPSSSFRVYGSGFRTALAPLLEAVMAGSNI